MRTHWRDIRDGLVEGDARERGVVLAFLAMILFTLIVMAGLAVDVGNWWWTGQKVQKAADAAAMAGVTYMPDDLAAAQSLANDVAQRNGYENGTNATIVSAADDRPTELRVTITTDVDNFFTSILGIEQTTIERTAVADYVGSVPMGSPADYLGQDPETAGRLQKLWLNVSGRASTKASGDRFTSRTCGTSTYGCSGDNTDSDHNGNNEYLFDSAGTSNNGYRFVIRVDAASTNPLKVQAYDPAFIYQGDTCNVNMPTGGPTGQAQALQDTYSNHPTYGTFFNDAATRFAPSGNDFCPGDQRINSASNLNTAYVLRAPDDTPWSDIDNPVVCTKTFRPIDTSLYKYLNPTDPAFSWGADPTTNDAAYVRAYLHRWADICTVASASVEVGDYILQIRTNYSSDPTVTDLSVDTGGHNRFSLRAGYDSGVGIPSSTDVNIYANGKLPIYVNAASDSSPSFYLARILPTAAGRTLILEFFDIGDVGSNSGSPSPPRSVNMQVRPPSDSGMANFTDCTFKKDDDASSSTSSTCTLTNMRSETHNGRMVRVTIPIPAGYTCDTSVDTGCWVKIDLTFSSTATPNDTTTWSASIDGDPIRLVE
jgi:hypothetical protein